jgi:hypothetical protein
MPISAGSSGGRKTFRMSVHPLSAAFLNLQLEQLQGMQAHFRLFGEELAWTGM